MKGCWNICERKVYLSFFLGGGVPRTCNFSWVFGVMVEISLSFFLSFVFSSGNFSNKPNSQQKKGWFWDPFFHGKMIWQSSNFATFTKKFRWPAQKLRPESQHRDSMGFLSTPPLTILYSHGNAEDPAAAMGWGGNWLKLRGFPLRGVQPVGAHLVVGTERNVEGWLRNWMCTWLFQKRKLWYKMKHEVLFNRKYLVESFRKKCWFTNHFFHSWTGLSS